MQRADLVVDTTDQHGLSPGLRLGFLDALRGAAVLFVLVQHVGERLSARFVAVSRHDVQVGQLGVMVFFLISGFIIPATLERNQSLRTFWTGRVLRLYPMFWVSLAAAAVLVAVDRAAALPAPAGVDWIANATMVPVFLGAPNAIGVYWSLAYELVFYVVMSVLFALGLHRRTVALSALASLFCLLGAVGFRLVLHHGVPLAVFNLATMFTGTVFYRLLQGAVRRSVAIVLVGGCVLAGVVVLQFALHGESAPDPDGARSIVPMTSAWVGAYVVFIAGFTVFRTRSLRLLRGLGRISYSVYLVQGVVIAAVPVVINGPVTATVWIATTVVVSICTYRFVEVPGISLGRRLIRTRTTSRSEGPAVRAAPARGRQ